MAKKDITHRLISVHRNEVIVDEEQKRQLCDILSKSSYWNVEECVNSIIKISQSDISLRFTEAEARERKQYDRAKAILTLRNGNVALGNRSMRTYIPDWMAKEWCESLETEFTEEGIVYRRSISLEEAKRKLSSDTNYVIDYLIRCGKIADGYYDEESELFKDVRGNPSKYITEDLIKEYGDIPIFRCDTSTESLKEYISEKEDVFRSRAEFNKVRYIKQIAIVRCFLDFKKALPERTIDFKKSWGCQCSIHCNKMSQCHSSHGGEAGKHDCCYLRFQGKMFNPSCILSFGCNMQCKKTSQKKDCCYIVYQNKLSNKDCRIIFDCLNVLGLAVYIRKNDKGEWQVSQRLDEWYDDPSLDTLLKEKEKRFNQRKDDYELDHGIE